MSNPDKLKTFKPFQIEDLKIIKKIGAGSFGEVYLTQKEKYPNMYFATKTMSSNFALSDKYRKYFNNEIYILRNLKHKNIIELYEIKRTTSCFYLVFNYCNGGTLSSIIKKYKAKYNRVFLEEESRNIIKQISNALYYLNSKNIIHRDVKLENILVNFSNEQDKENLNMLNAEIKIIDFGFARFLNQNELANSVLGSPFNMDPILLQGIVNKKYVNYDEKADIWGLATLSYNIFTGFLPFVARNHKDLFDLISKGDYYFPLNVQLSKQALSFLINILQNKPENRLSIIEIVNHEFLIKDKDNREFFSYNNIPKNLVYYNDRFKLSCSNKDFLSILNKNTKEDKIFNIDKTNFRNTTSNTRNNNVNENNALNTKNIGDMMLKTFDSHLIIIKKI